MTINDKPSRNLAPNSAAFYFVSTSAVALLSLALPATIPAWQCVVSYLRVGNDNACNEVHLGEKLGPPRTRPTLDLLDTSKARVGASYFKTYFYHAFHTWRA
eukprot:3561602-Amphidinium_carterae.1